MLKRPELFTLGFHSTSFKLPEFVRPLVQSQDWRALDESFKHLTSAQGSLFEVLQTYHDFKSMEFIINIRDSANEWEEDGIWHDDGSRLFAFSLSLTLGDIEGGYLGIRRKGEEGFTSLPTPKWGGLTLFLTGVHGFEHKVHRVTHGKRIVIAGWCSDGPTTF